MELKDVLGNRNAGDQVYMSDIARFLGYKVWDTLSFKERVELQDKFTEVGELCHSDQT